MKPLFSRNPDAYKNADLNWRMDTNDSVANYKALADGYKDAVITLLDSVIQNNALHRADSLIFPIMFCAYQYIELVLKGTLRKAGKLQGRATHDIQKYYEEVVSLFVAQGKSDSDVRSNFSLLQNFIDEIWGKIAHTNDKGKNTLAFEFGRFPTGNDGNTPLFYVTDINSLVSIDLVNFRAIMEEITELLDGLFYIDDYKEEEP